MKANVFLNRYKSWGHEIDPSKVKVRQVLRVNTLKIAEEELVDRLKAKGAKLEKVKWLSSAYFYESRFALSSTPEYLFGYFYIQDAASQIPAMILEPEPGETVLDMAAAPGGKTTQVCALMKNSGAIVALDVRHERIDSLKNNIERMGCKNVVVYNKDASYASDLGIQFDKVLLDAPCSGNFCIDNDWFTKRKTEDFTEKSEIQKKLLREAVKVAKKGGIIVYSTCSLEKEEDEEVIEWAQGSLGVSLLDVDIKIGEPGLTQKTGKARRFWPDKTKTQGFFVAKMVKG